MQEIVPMCEYLPMFLNGVLYVHSRVLFTGFHFLSWHSDVSTHLCLLVSWRFRPP